MLTQIKLIAAGLLAALTAVLAAFYVGKSKGKAQVQNDTLKTQNEVKAGQLDIAAKPNPGPADIINSMRNGEL